MTPTGAGLPGLDERRALRFAPDLTRGEALLAETIRELQGSAIGCRYSTGRLAILADATPSGVRKWWASLVEKGYGHEDRSGRTVLRWVAPTARALAAQERRGEQLSPSKGAPMAPLPAPMAPLEENLKETSTTGAAGWDSREILDIESRHKRAREVRELLRTNRGGQATPEEWLAFLVELDNADARIAAKTLDAFADTDHGHKDSPPGAAFLIGILRRKVTKAAKASRASQERASQVEQDEREILALSATWPTAPLVEARAVCASQRKTGKIAPSKWLATLRQLAKYPDEAVVAATTALVERHSDKGERYLIGIARGMARDIEQGRPVARSSRPVRRRVDEGHYDEGDDDDPRWWETSADKAKDGVAA